MTIDHNDMLDAVFFVKRPGDMLTANNFFAMANLSKMPTAAQWKPLSFSYQHPDIDMYGFVHEKHTKNENEALQRIYKHISCSEDIQTHMDDGLTGSLISMDLRIEMIQNTDIKDFRIRFHFD